MSASRATFGWVLVLGLVAPLGWAPQAAAQMRPISASADDDEQPFNTGWIGLRLGIWYRPTIDMRVLVSGQDRSNPLVGLFGSDFNIKRDLGVRESPKSEYLVDFDGEAIPELEVFVETEWVSLFAAWIPPFRYEGETVVTRELSFGGQTFSASSTVESRFRHTFLGVDLELNLFNNRAFRISPLVSARAFAIDYEVKDSEERFFGRTSDIDSPLQYNEWHIFPYPELGIDVRVGAREWIEGSLKLAGSFIRYYGLEGGTLRIEVAVTAYPIRFVGVQLGARYLMFDVQSQTDSASRSFDFDLEFFGIFGGVIIRFG